MAKLFWLREQYFRLSLSLYLSLTFSLAVSFYDSSVFTHSCRCPVWKRAKWLFQKSFGVLMGNGRQLQADTWNFFHLINSHSQWTFSNTRVLCTLHNMYMYIVYATWLSHYSREWVSECEMKWEVYDDEQTFSCCKHFAIPRGRNLCSHVLSYFYCFFSLCALRLIFNGKCTHMNKRTQTHTRVCFASSYLWIQLRCWKSSTQARAQAVWFSNCNNCGYLKPNSCPWTRKNPFTLIGMCCCWSFREKENVRACVCVCVQANAGDPPDLANFHRDLMIIAQNDSV